MAATGDGHPKKSSPGFSVNLMPSGSIGQVVELAQLAEQCGARRCWVFDEGVSTRDVWVTLAAIAAGTESILIGPGITNPFVRHPASTIGAVATLDEMSGGRAFLGLGAGGGLTLGPLGIERRRPLSAVRDMIETMRGLLAGKEVSIESETFRLRDARLDYGRPDIEIIVAGRGPKMTALGGEVADGFTLSYIHRELLGEHAASLRAAAAQGAGRDGRPFLISYATAIAVTEAEAEAARSGLTYRLVDSPQAVKERIGMTEDETIAIRAALAAGGPNAAAGLVRPEWVEQFVITGTVQECRVSLHETLASNDVDEYQLPVLDLERGGEQIERVASFFESLP